MAAVSSGSSLLAPPGPSRSISYHGTRAASGGRANSPPLGSSSAVAGPSSPPTARPRAATSSGATPARVPLTYNAPTLSVATRSPPDPRLTRRLSADALKSAAEVAMARKASGGRQRSASIVSVTEIRADYDDALDTEILQNVRAHIPASRPTASACGQLRALARARCRVRDSSSSHFAYADRSPDQRRLGQFQRFAACPPGRD